MKTLRGKVASHLTDFYVRGLTSKSEFFAKIVNSGTIFAKSSILDVLLGSEYAFVYIMGALLINK